MSSSRIRTRHSSTRGATVTNRNMVMHVHLKFLAALFCTLSLAIAKETQLKLEDIERDNLKNEKNLQFQQQLPQLLQNPQQQQQQQRGTLQNLPPRQYYATVTAAPPPAPPTSSVPPQQSVGPHQFSPDARQFPPAPPLHVQFPNRIPQQQLIAIPDQPLEYLAQSRISLDPAAHGQQQPQFQFQYVPNNINSIIQDSYVPQYHGPTPPQQFIYIQPQPSQNIPIQAKPQLEGIQYVQYLDPNTEYLRDPQTHVRLQNPHQHKHSHNLAGLIQKYAYTNTLPVNYRQPAPQTYRPQGDSQQLLNQNVYVVPQVVQPINANLQPIYQHQVQPPRAQPQVLGQRRLLVPGITYVNRQKPDFQQEAQQSIANVVYRKREPKSLLDSYVPSVLQIQYYKHLQEQEKQNNALKIKGKPSENIVGKSDVVKNLPELPARKSAKETIYEYKY